MNYFEVQQGSTSQMVEFDVFDSSSTVGARLAGLVYNTSSLTAYYNLQNAAGAATAISLVTMTKGTWTSGGFVAVDATNMPGVYQLCLPNAAVAASAGVNYVTVVLKGATNMVPVVLNVRLTNWVASTTPANTLTVAATGEASANTTKINGTAQAAADLGTVCPAIKTQTDKLAFTVANKVDANTLAVSGTAQTARDLGASVLLSAGTGTGQLDFTAGVVKANLAQILGTALTETAGYLAAGFKMFFNVASPVHTVASINQTGDSYARLGAPSGASIDADILTRSSYAGGDTSGTTTLLSRIVGTLASGTHNPQSGDSYARLGAPAGASVSADVATVSAKTTNLPASPAAVGSNMGTVTSVTGNVAGNVTGSVGSVATGGITTASFAAGAVNAAAVGVDALAAIADKLLGRSIAGSADGGHTVRDALRALRNKVSVSAGTMTVTQEDDVTTAWTATVTTDGSALPITTIAPTS